MNNSNINQPSSNILIIPTLSQIKDVFKEVLREELPQIAQKKLEVNERLYTKKEAADYLRISVSKLDGLRRQKPFGKRIGARVLFTKGELDGLLV